MHQFTLYRTEVLKMTKAVLVPLSVPTAPGMNSSYCTEAYGMLAGMTLLEGHLRVSNVKFTKMRTVLSYSNNEALVKIVNKLHRQQLTVRNYYTPDIDLELQILDMLKKLETHNILIIVQHICGHQDKHTVFSKVTCPAQLNVADELATSTIPSMPVQTYYEFPTNCVNLRINGSTITSNTTHFLRKASLSQQLRAYLTDNFQWSCTIPDLIW